MVSEHVKSLLETPKFPIVAVNEASAREKQGGGRPPYWEMVFWWTRKPLISARSVVLGALLQSDVEPGKFAEWVRLTAKTPHRESPALPPELRERLKDVKLLDPFAGFGSIPLEAVRLGIGDVVATELLPTAYVFLKAVLEHPKNYGTLKTAVSGEELRRLGLEHVARKLANAKKVEGGKTYEIPALIYDVAKWGDWVAEQLRNDPDIKELYDDDVAVYIGTWEVRCPICGRYTPLVGNWWLARVKGGAHAYMKPKVVGDGVVVEVVKSSKGVPEPNINARQERAKCLLCGAEITYVNPETGKVLERKGGEGEFHPKYAVKDWNQKLEQYLRRQADLQTLKQAQARSKLLVKVKIVEKDLEFEPATQEDNEKLWKALEKLRQIWGDPDIPTEPTPSYDQEFARTHLWGMDKWFKLFNPRQLLTLVKLVKLIREAGKKVEEEKLREGWSKEEAYRYAEAVTTYLAINLAHFADYDSIVTAWHSGFWGLMKVVHTLSFRGIAMTWNWSDVNPVSCPSVSYSEMLKGYTIEGLSYLVSAVSGSPSRVRVLLDDATMLSKLSGEKFDVIVTDPPYRDDVAYAELSDFYYVWLKRALSDDGLSPKFYPEAFAYNTQWESFALREASYNEGRMEFFGVDAVDHYRRLLRSSFARMVEHLKDGGVVVTYYAHSSPDAWRDLVDSARYSKLTPTVAWLITTESMERVTARGKTALEASIVIAWRKASEAVRGEYAQVVDEAVKRAEETVNELQGRLGWADVFVASMVKALSAFMTYSKVLKYGRELTVEDMVRESYAVATKVVSGATPNIRSPEMMLYLTAKRMFKTEDGKTLLSSQDLITLSYGLTPEGWRRFEDARVVKSLNGSSKTKEYVLVEPYSTDIEELKRVLDDHGVSAVNYADEVRGLTSVGVLHLLEYFARQGCTAFTKVFKELYALNQQVVREAIEAARVIQKQFKYSKDPETELAENIIACVGG